MVPWAGATLKETLVLQSAGALSCVKLHHRSLQRLGARSICHQIHIATLQSTAAHLITHQSPHEGLECVCVRVCVQNLVWLESMWSKEMVLGEVIALITSGDNTHIPTFILHSDPGVLT